MIDSLVSDIKGQLQYGNMVVRLIFINIFVFILITLVGIFVYGGQSSGFFQNLIRYLALPSDFSTLIRRPWTLFTHMFLHQGFGHVFWNMLILFWFGRIVGDLLGDRRILPLYISGGLAGALFYLIFANFLSPYGGIALGASAAVMCIVVASGFIAPHYRLNLLLIGEVKLMYVVAALFFIDLAMIGQNSNAGGHFAHIGGAVFGGFYIYNMQRSGVDLLNGLVRLFEKNPFEVEKRRRSGRVIKINGPEKKKHDRSNITQEDIDEILDKIKLSGYDSLSEEEKDVLYKASKE